jgi:hypothetical protein
VILNLNLYAPLLALPWILVPIGCTRQDVKERPAAAELGSSDSWLNRSPSSIEFRRGLSSVSESKLFSVVPSKLSEAEAELDTVSWKRLGPDDTDEMIGRQVELRPGECLVLLRSVGTSRDPDDRYPDELHVGIADGVVVVVRDEMRLHTDGKLRKMPVVAALPWEPVKVFVEVETVFTGRAAPEWSNH